MKTEKIYLNDSTIPFEEALKGRRKVDFEVYLPEDSSSVAIHMAAIVTQVFYKSSCKGTLTLFWGKFDMPKANLGDYLVCTEITK